MLLITRRENEAIVINGSITVKVLEVRGGRVKLGFEFPSGSTVYRQELFSKIQAENLAAAQAAGGAEPAALNTALDSALKNLQKKLTTTEPKNDNPANASKPSE